MLDLLNSFTDCLKKREWYQKIAIIGTTILFLGFIVSVIYVLVLVIATCVIAGNWPGVIFIILGIFFVYCLILCAVNL